MRAELVFMGKRVDMAARAHRRAMVVGLYSALALGMVGLFFADRWRVSGYYLVFATFLINRVFLGGYASSWLVKPFNEKAPRRSDVAPPFLLLALRVYRPVLGENAYRIDERELEQRGRAHYQAYQALTVVLAVLWLPAGWSAFKPAWMAGFGPAVALVVYGLVLAGIVLALTLPQAILLWTEPDMEADGDQVEARG
jgi:hypothetical protein